MHDDDFDAEKTAKDALEFLNSPKGKKTIEKLPKFDLGPIVERNERAKRIKFLNEVRWLPITI